MAMSVNAFTRRELFVYSRDIELPNHIRILNVPLEHTENNIKVTVTSHTSSEFEAV